MTATLAPTITPTGTSTPTPTATQTATPTATATAVNNAIFVTNSGNNSITAYSSGASGNAVPIAVIRGPQTSLRSPSGIAIDSSGNLYVVNRRGGFDGRGFIAIYPAGTSGNTAPAAIISGPNTGLDFPKDIDLDSSGIIYVSNSSGGPAGEGSITIYAAGSTGDADPIGTITGPSTGFDNLQGLTLDLAANIYVTNAPKARFNLPSAMEFLAGSIGDVTPAAEISGTQTGLDTPNEAAVDSSGNLYVANRRGGPARKGSITVYSADANGDAAPIATITGRDTGLVHPAGIALDLAGNLYVANPGKNSVTVYAPGANGDAAPIAIIKGAKTGLRSPQDIVAGSVVP